MGLPSVPTGSTLTWATEARGSVSAFDVAADGSLTPVAGSPFTTGAQHLRGQLRPLTARTFTSQPTAVGNVFAYDVAPNGSLTAVAGSPFATGSGPVGVAATPDGKHLFVGNAAAASISAYNIAANGSLTAVAGSPFASPPGPIYTAISPDGAHLFVSHNNSTVSSFAVAADGALSPVAGSPFATGGNTPDFQSVAVSPDQPPVAAFTAAQLKPGSPVSFDATGSTDSDGTIARYDWDFGDGTVLADGGPTPSHDYAQPGTYQVKVTLTDNEGCSTALDLHGPDRVVQRLGGRHPDPVRFRSPRIPPRRRRPSASPRRSPGVPSTPSEKDHVKFKFFSDDRDAAFACKLKLRGLNEPVAGFTPCVSPKRYRRLEPGRYKFKVRATDAAGNTDPTPAVFKFKLSD